MNDLPPIALNSNDFAQIRSNGCIYVDKTAQLHRLVTDREASLFFVSRPRRFGKSLMLSTLHALFDGRRELFDGLDISRTDYDWRPSPVLHFNFSFCAASSYAQFMEGYPATVGRSLREAGYSSDPSLAPHVDFKNAIDFFAARGTPCAVLIDEYDDPVAKALARVEEAERIRDTLSTFYGQIKDSVGKIRFLMMTGVSKFTKLSVFSALSNLTDLSEDSAFATMLGFTDEELDRCFAPHMRAHAKAMGLSDEAYRRELERWFNGYRFSPYEPRTVYNPVSVGWTLAKRAPSFSGTWTETGRPSMLMHFLKREQVFAVDYDHVLATPSSFDVSDLANLRPAAMLYQAGYLTIRDFDDGVYTLGIPDEEVRRDLSLLLTGVAADRDMAWAAELGVRLRTGMWDEFFTGIRSLYAALPYGSREEGERTNEFSYQRVLCVLLASQGFRYRAEDVQSDGRAVVVAEHPCGVYLFELKVDDTAETALAQIKRKGYDAPYRGKPLPIWAVGLAFDSRTRRLAGTAVERLA